MSLRALKLSLLLTGIFTLLFSMSPKAMAGTYYVSPTGTGRGASESDACSLQNIINLLMNPATGCREPTILSLSPGTYHLNAVLNFPPSCPVTIQGTGTSAEETILDGDFRGRVIDIAPNSPFIQLINLTIQRGMVTNNRGGGIRIQDRASLILSNVHIRNNIIQMEGCDGVSSGAGIYNQWYLSADRVYLYNNYIREPAHETVCGIFGADSTYHMSGAGLSNTGLAVITHSTISHNSIDFPNIEGSSTGAGIANSGSQARLYLGNVTMSQNRSFASDYELVGTIPFGMGGGLGNTHGAQAYLSHVTFFQNEASRAGNEITNGTIDDNEQSYPGGQIYLHNSIVKSNHDVEGNQYYNIYGAVSSHSNNIFAFQPPFSLESNERMADPNLNEELANNGGSTPTHALQQGSIAIDGLRAPFVGYPLNYPIDLNIFQRDQRGVLRSTIGDIGAFEYVTLNLPPPGNSSTRLMSGGSMSNPPPMGSAGGGAGSSDLAPMSAEELKTLTDHVPSELIQKVESPLQ